MPALYLDRSGKAGHPVLVPGLKHKDLKGRSLVIHAGGDNYPHQSAALGGGGGVRFACGHVSIKARGQP